MAENYDFRKMEHKWQERWKEAKAFEPKVDSEKRKFFFTTPYPYISGSLHIGHGRAVTESDVYVRYMRMKGWNVLYPLAFHITGTPILGISAAIEANDQAKTELYKGYVKNYVKNEHEADKVVQSFRDPWNIVNFFISKMVDEYSSLGLSIDWTRRFTTGDPDYQKFITWQFLKYKEKDFLIKGSYPVLFCPKCDNAVGEDDIQDADTNPVSKMEFTLLKFKLEDAHHSGLILVAATLRPETVFGQTNLWVNPDVEYDKIKVGEETWVVSKEGREKLEFQKKNIEAMGFIKGRDLIGKFARAPGIHKEVIILPSKFVDANVGSGIVTSVPSDAPYDWMALKDLQQDREETDKYGLNHDVVAAIKPIPIINIPGWGDMAALKIAEQMNLTSQHDPRLDEATQVIYKEGFHTGTMNHNCGKYSGMKVTEAKEKVKKELLESGQADVIYETSRVAHCRDGTKVVVSVLEDQWFLDFNAKGWKEKAHKCLKAMELLPDAKRKMFEDTFEWLDKRPAARRRGLGTQLPFDRNWIIESLSDSTVYMSFYIIKNLINKHHIKPEQLEPAFFDYVYTGHGEPAHVSKATGIKIEDLKEMRSHFDYWYPNDHRHTYVAHLSNHLSFFIFAHAALFPEKYWPKKISFHGFVQSEGMKMSKSKGNVITLLEIKNKYGADTFRAYITTATTLEGTFDWKAHEAENVQKNLYNIHELVLEMIHEHKKDATHHRKQPGPAGFAFLSKFESALLEADKALSEMRLRDYGNIVIHSIPSWIKKLQRRADAHEVRTIFDMITDRYIRMLNPVVPHLSEEMWAALGKKGFASLHEWPEAEKKMINPKHEACEELVDRVADDVRSVLKLVKFQPKRVFVYVSEKWKYELFKKLKDEIEKTRDIGKIMKAVASKEHGAEIAKIVPFVLKDPSRLPKHVLDQEDELVTLVEAGEFLKREFGIPIDVLNADEQKTERAGKAMPGKPGIEVE
ncbi:MAG: leucine--tRNA ligase [Candidatus Aenigmatarchaeota archaeon]